MTLEDRITRIEAALASAGLLEIQPVATREEILNDLKAGDVSSLRTMLRRNKGRITDEWPFGGKKSHNRKHNQKERGHHASTDHGTRLGTDHNPTSEIGKNHEGTDRRFRRQASQRA
jgi:hypothetical protein